MTQSISDLIWQIRFSNTIFATSVDLLLKFLLATTMQHVFKISVSHYSAHPNSLDIYLLVCYSYQKLKENSEELASGSENFASMASQLAKQMENRKWWQLWITWFELSHQSEWLDWSVWFPFFPGHFCPYNLSTNLIKHIEWYCQHLRVICVLVLSVYRKFGPFI